MFKKIKGLSMVEVLLVLGIFAVVAGGASISLSRLINQSLLNTSVLQAVRHLRQAQKNSLFRYRDSAWGIYLDEAADTITLFRGNDFISRDPAADTRLALPHEIDLKNINLTGGGREIRFRKGGGDTDQSGAFELEDKNHRETRVLSINPYGVIEK